MKTFEKKSKMTTPPVRRGRTPAIPSFNPAAQIQRAQIRQVLRSPQVQAKLTIGQPNDKYEQEADWLPEQVMLATESRTRQEPSTFEPRRISSSRQLDSGYGVNRGQPLIEEENMVQGQHLNNEDTPITPTSLPLRSEGTTRAATAPKRERTPETPKQVLISVEDVTFQQPEPVIVPGYIGWMMGGGHHKPKMDAWVIYNDEKQVWVIWPIISTFIRVWEPPEGAYPVVGLNVLNDETLGLRKPKNDPKGKGYWEKVVENLRLYGPDVNYNDFQWWVKGSTLFHEKIHRDLYKEWFNKNWREFKKEMWQRLQEQLERNEIQPVNETQLGNKARFILQDINNRKPDTEKRTREITRDEYWEPKAVRVYKEAYDLFVSGAVMRMPEPRLQRQVEPEEEEEELKET